MSIYMSRSKVRAGKNWQQYSLLTRLFWSRVSIAPTFDQDIYVYKKRFQKISTIFLEAIFIVQERVLITGINYIGDKGDRFAVECSYIRKKSIVVEYKWFFKLS